VPTITNLTSGAGSALTSFPTASVAPTGNRLILVSVHAYISTGSVQPSTPTVTGNGITYALVKAQDVDNAGTDRATEWVFRGLAASPSSGAITISFGAVTMTRCAWSVDQSDSDIDLSGSNGYGAIAQSVGATSAGATSLSVNYSPSMRSDSAGYSVWGHQTQEVMTPRASWTELSDVTSVTLATMETQWFSGTDTAASAAWATSGRAGGIALEIKKAAPIIWVGAYALQGGTTGLTMTPPSGTQAGDLEVMWVADKNSSVDPTDPGSGWTRIDSQQVGTGADGVGTGLIRLTAWYRILTGTSTNTSITITGANRSLGGGQVYRLTGAGSFATPTATFGSDTDSSTTSFAAVMAADLGAGVDDYTLSIGAFTAVTALNGRSLTIPNSTQSRYDQIDSAGGAVGNQIFVWTDQRVTMVGAQSGAATTGATSGVGTTGGAINIRISLAASGTAEGGGSASAAMVSAKAVKVAMQSASCGASVGVSGTGRKQSPQVGRNFASASTQGRAGKVTASSSVASAAAVTTGRAAKVAPRAGLASAAALGTSVPRKVAVEKAQVTAAAVSYWISVALPHAVCATCSAATSARAAAVRVAPAKGLSSTAETATGRAMKRLLASISVSAAGFASSGQRKRQAITALASSTSVSSGRVVKVSTQRGVAITVVFVSAHRGALSYITPRPDIGTTARPTAGVTPRPQLGTTERPRVFT
jgi:hypothetical protein